MPLAELQLLSPYSRNKVLFSVSGITSFQLLTPPKLAFAPDSIEAAPTSSRQQQRIFFIVLTCLLGVGAEFP
jgi:hypothetical protein